VRKGITAQGLLDIVDNMTEHQLLLALPCASMAILSR
jgi:hypothetical protein